MLSVNPTQIAGQFTRQAITGITPLGCGLINDTYRVAGADSAFVLQRLNQHVFPAPQLIMANLEYLGRHIRQKPPETVGLQFPGIIYTLSGQTYFQDAEQQFWRALELIQPAESRQVLNRATESAQIGYALAHFHRLCSDLPVSALHDTLPGFHITPGYYQDYQQLAERNPTIEIDSEFEFCRNFIRQFQTNINVLEDAKAAGILSMRVTHGDPKLNNFLFRPGADQIISLIDLDTVKPGLVHYDIGDCIRSCCHIKPDNHFDIQRCRIILEHYLQEAGSFFTPADYLYLSAAIVLIPFELGLRFFSDYLAGNQYFKITEPRSNLYKAIALFELCQSINAQLSELNAIILSFQH